MFHEFVSFVHVVNTGFNPEFKVWTDREKEILEFLNYQLSYNRSLDDQEKKFPVPLDAPKFQNLDKDSAIHYEMASLRAVLKWEGEQVLGLEQGWIEFLEEQIPDFGKYLGTVTFDGTEEPIMGCLNCGDDFLKSQGLEQDDEMDYDHILEIGNGDYSWNADGLYFTFRMDEKEYVEVGECACPKCGRNVGAFTFEEGPDINTVWIFEKGSISYSHYGRGAGLSARFHENGEVTGDPVAHFKDCRKVW